MADREIDFDAQTPPVDESGAYDLEAFAPAAIKFRVGGRLWQVSGDPDVDVVAKMLRIEDAVRADDGVTVARAITEGKELLASIATSVDDVEREKAVSPVPLAALDALAALLEDGDVDAAQAEVGKILAGGEAYQQATAGDLRLGVGQILTLFSLVTGGTSVADAVAAAIRDEAAGGGPLATGSKDSAGERSSQSVEGSSERSSDSEPSAGGRRATTGGSRGASSRRTSQKPKKR